MIRARPAALGVARRVAVPAAARPVAGPGALVEGGPKGHVLEVAGPRVDQAALEVVDNPAAHVSVDLDHLGPHGPKRSSGQAVIELVGTSPRARGLVVVAAALALDDADAVLLAGLVVVLARVGAEAVALHVLAGRGGPGRIAKVGRVGHLGQALIGRGGVVARGCCHGCRTGHCGGHRQRRGYGQGR